MAREKRTYAQELCVKAAGLAMQRAAMLRPGCRIGVAVSGGVDSFVLLKTLRIRQGIIPFPFEIMALHCNPGFEPRAHAQLIPWLAAEGISGHVELTDHGPEAHSARNRKRSACFRCAWLRRKRLFDLCRQYSLTHLALGHTADDLATTFFLNIFRNGRVDGLAMSEAFFGGSLELARPLLLVEKKYISTAARQWGLPVWRNACPSAGHTARSQMESALRTLCADIPDARRTMLRGLTRWQLALSETDAARDANHKYAAAESD